jgi:potassium efflux system protein
MRRLPAVLTRFALLAFFVSGAIATAADAPAEAPAATKPAPPAIEPIGPAAIPLRADADERFVQDVMARARQADPSAKLVAPLDSLATGVRELSETFKSDDLQLLPAIRLESLERHWNFYDGQLADWRAQLQRVTGRYTELAAELAKRRAVWEATRDAPERGSLPPALSERVESVLAEITQAERALSLPLDHQLDLARRGNAVQLAVDSGRKAVVAAIAYYDRRLLTIDAPPLWQAWHDLTVSEQAIKGLTLGLQIENQFLQEYNRARVVSSRIRTLITLGLLPFFLWLSRRSRATVSEDPELQASNQVLQRPISSWLLLALVGVLFFEPDAPLILHQSALVLALIPVLRLLPRKVFTLLGPWPYIATGLYLLYQLGFLLVGVPPLHRLHQLVIAALTLGALLWLLLRSQRPAAASRLAVQSRVVRVFGWLAAGALVVGMVGTVLGNVTLGEVLTSGVLDGGYVGLVLYAGTAVLNSILKLLLARREVSRFRVVSQRTGPLLQRLAQLIGLGAFLIWIVVVLNQFRVYRPMAAWVLGVMRHPIGYGEISVTLSGVLTFLASVWVAFWLARTIRIVLQDEVLQKMELPRGVGNSIATLTYYALVTIGLSIALVASGFQMSQLTIVVGALGVGIGFGLQNVVNNFVSGLILMFERPIQPGDVVEVSGTAGKVRDIGMRATTLTTFEGADVVVPNGTLLSEKLINWTLSDMNRRLEVNVGVAYGSDPKQVIELLLQVAKSTPGVAGTPEPGVIFVGFGASSLDFAIRAWTNNYGEWVAIRSDMTIRVYDALNAAGIEIPFPQQDLHVRSVSPAAAARLAGLEPRPAS